jgi:hypothetical protein
MNVTVPDTGVVGSVADFAAAVRAALSDLPADEVDELTDGLEADLHERLMDASSASATELGDPVAYATELRTAAGLPARASTAAPLFSFSKLREWWDELRTATADIPGAGSIASFLIALRPVWWVLRAWIAYVVLATFITHTNETLPSTFLRAIAFAALAVVSVQFGRGKWLSNRWIRRLFIAGNVIAVLAIPFVVGLAANQIANDLYVVADDYVEPGMFRDGTQITNIFAYDSQGNPLTNVQLFDQEGNPLSTGFDGQDYLWTPAPDGTDAYLVPNNDVVGRPGWNVFPLDSIGDDGFDPDDGNVLPDAARTPVTPPFLIVAPLAGVSSLIPTATPSPE